MDPESLFYENKKEIEKGKGHCPFLEDAAGQNVHFFQRIKNAG